MLLPSLQVAEEWAQGTFKLNPNDEDIHTANERRLKVQHPLLHPLPLPSLPCPGPLEHKHHHSVHFITGTSEQEASAEMAEIGQIQGTPGQGGRVTGQGGSAAAWLTPLGCEQADPNCMPPSTARSSLVKPRGSCTRDEVGTTRCRHLPAPPPGAFLTLGGSREQS